MHKQKNRLMAVFCFERNTFDSVLVRCNLAIGIGFGIRMGL
jgi:hypothetical protein